jgi:Double-GTPase 2
MAFLLEVGTAVAAGVFIVIATVLVAVVTAVIYAVMFPSLYLRSLILLTTRSARDRSKGDPVADPGVNPRSSDGSWRVPRRTAQNRPQRLRNFLAPLMPGEERSVVAPPPDGDSRPGASNRPGVQDQSGQSEDPENIQESDADTPDEWPPSPGDRERAWLGSHVDQQVAFPSYFFGPAADDIRFVVRTCARRCRVRFEDGKNAARRARDYNAAIIALVTWAGIRVGLVIGGLLGLAGVAAIAVLNMVVAAMAMVVAGFSCLLLRGADVARRFMRGIVMTCPMACSIGIIPNPVYLCPRCAERHRDVRPGRYGIARRLCKCGFDLRTSLLIGAGGMPAECPHCHTVLPEKFGTMASIVIVFFGALNVGKTQLMFTMAEALNELVSASGGTITFDADSQERLEGIGDRIKSAGRPQRTTPEPPAAYVGQIELGLDKRLLYLFDTAGELYYRQEGLNYLSRARCLVFVADPLASESVWGKFPAERQEQLEGVRSDRAEVDLAYQQTREQMRRMGSKRKFARLAFVVSKADLLDEIDLTPRSGEENQFVRTLVEEREGLDMGDLVRESRQNFADVEFFPTAAVLSDDEFANGSVMSLARWVLKSEGIHLSGSN